MQGIRRSDRCSGRRFSAAHSVFTFVALLAMLLQTAIVQPHIHMLGALASSAVEQTVGEHGADEHVTLPHEQAACIVCQALAASGSATLAPATLLHDLRAPVATIAVSAHATAPRATSHAWRSRAPPTFL